MKQKHLVIVRSGGSIIDFNSYNCQELGLAKALGKKGWRVSIVLAGTAYKEDYIEVSGGEAVTVYSLPFKSINQQLAWFMGIDDLLKKLKPDLIQIHEFGMWMSFHVARWARKRRVPICMIQGSYRPTQKPVFRQLELLFNVTFGKYVLNRVQGIGYKSLQAEKYLRRYTRKQCMPTYIGLDDGRFSTSTQRDWKKELNVEGKHLLLYVGNMEPRRNPLFLLDVMERLTDDYVLVMAGDGVLIEKMEATVKDRGLEEKCVLLGKLRQEELPSLYKASDLFLLASDYEIYGMVILESMYFGTPVISTLTAGAEVLISSKVDGMILPEKSVDLWSETISGLCNDEERLSMMSRFASQKIANELTWAKASDKFITLYENITEMKTLKITPPNEPILVSCVIIIGIDCRHCSTQNLAA